MKPSHMCFALSAVLTISNAAPAAPPGPTPSGGGISAYLAACMREKSTEAISSAAADRLCHLSFGRVVRSRPVAQLIIDAALPRAKPDNAAMIQKRFPPLKWGPPDNGIMIGDLGGDWYAMLHGQSPVKMLTIMWMGKEEPSFAVPAALRLLGAKVEPLMCQIKPNGVDRVYWVTPPGKPGLFFQIAEGQKDEDGLGGYSMAMNLKDFDRPPTPPFTPAEKAQGYTFDCPSEF